MTWHKSENRMGNSFRAHIGVNRSHSVKRSGSLSSMNCLGEALATSQSSSEPLNPRFDSGCESTGSHAVLFPKHESSNGGVLSDPTTQCGTGGVNSTRIGKAELLLNDRTSTQAASGKLRALLSGRGTRRHARGAALSKKNRRTCRSISITSSRSRTSRSGQM